LGLFLVLHLAKLTTLQGAFGIGDEDFAMFAMADVAHGEDEGIEDSSNIFMEEWLGVEDEDVAVADANVADGEDEGIGNASNSPTDDSLEDENALLRPPSSRRGSRGSNVMDRGVRTTLGDRTQANRLVCPPVYLAECFVTENSF
jgi:hypothetical protein